MKVCTGQRSWKKWLLIQSLNYKECLVIGRLKHYVKPESVYLSIYLASYISIYLSLSLSIYIYIRYSEVKIHYWKYFGILPSSYIYEYCYTNNVSVLWSNRLFLNSNTSFDVSAGAFTVWGLKRLTDRKCLLR